ncbi:hypothetical protein [Priestia aryabhattai]|uniref:hypothetical protein n=1 Tax=Priestia aryabhattai TaxID=412384 RepID=UPI0032E917B6
MHLIRKKEMNKHLKNECDLKHIQQKLERFETERDDMIYLSQKFDEVVVKKMKEVHTEEIEKQVEELSDDEVIFKATSVLSSYLLRERFMYWHIQNPFQNTDVFSRENKEFQEAAVQKMILICLTALTDSMHNMPNYIANKNISSLRSDLKQFYRDRMVILEFIENHFKKYLPHMVYQNLKNDFPSAD